MSNRLFLLSRSAAGFAAAPSAGRRCFSSGIARAAVAAENSLLRQSISRSCRRGQASGAVVSAPRRHFASSSGPLRQQHDDSTVSVVDGADGKTTEPLRILFCGSDEFSCASLVALVGEKLTNPNGLIESIDVMVRPGKRTGRGLKVVRKVPVQTTAEKLGLTVHEKDGFQDWELPTNTNGKPINLIIAVSFGLFIPSRFLNASKYGGLNVHPSLLPDLHGAAPLQWSILLDRANTGVTLQTLDDRKFDNGVILSQTPPVAIPKGSKTRDLDALLAPVGASLLVDGLRKGLHVPAVREEKQLTAPAAGTLEDNAFHARKFTPADRQVPWDKLVSGEMRPADVDALNRAIGGPWGMTSPSPSRDVEVQTDSSSESRSRKPKRSASDPERVIFLDMGLDKMPQDAADRLQDAATVWWEVDGPEGKSRVKTTWIPDEEKQGAILLPSSGSGDAAAADSLKSLTETTDCLKASRLLVAGRPPGPAWRVITQLAKASR